MAIDGYRCPSGPLRRADRSCQSNAAAWQGLAGVEGKKSGTFPEPEDLNNLLYIVNTYACSEQRCSLSKLFKSLVCTVDLIP